MLHNDRNTIHIETIVEKLIRYINRFLELPSISVFHITAQRFDPTICNNYFMPHVVKLLPIERTTLDNLQNLAPA